MSSKTSSFEALSPLEIAQALYSTAFLLRDRKHAEERMDAWLDLSEGEQRFIQGHLLYLLLASLNELLESHYAHMAAVKAGEKAAQRQLEGLEQGLMTGFLQLFRRLDPFEGKAGVEFSTPMTSREQSQPVPSYVSIESLNRDSNEEAHHGG